MGKHAKPKEFHCQALVWSKDSPTGDFKRGYFITATKREHQLSIYESKQKFLIEQEKGHPKLQGKEYESHIWCLNLIDVGRNLAYRKLSEPLTRAPNVLEDEYYMADNPDKAKKIAERKWYFDFTKQQILDLNEDGEIDLTRAESEAIIKKTDKTTDKFIWSS